MLGLSRRGRLVKQGSLFADQRGAVAFEMLIVFAFLILVLLLPLADMAIAGFKFISARQALRAFGQSILYTPPDDVTSPSPSWTDKLDMAETALGYPITNFKVLCDGSTCTSANSTRIKNYSYSTIVTLNPWPLMKPVLCTGGGTDGCTFTLNYSERFQ